MFSSLSSREKPLILMLASRLIRNKHMESAKMLLNNSKIKILSLDRIAMFINMKNIQNLFILLKENILTSTIVPKKEIIKRSTANY